MKQFMAFTKKEFLEELRTGKMLIMGILFCLFGIMNPAIAKMTPWMYELMSEQLAKSGMVLTEMKVDAGTSWIQFFKNMPILLIVFLVMFSNILTAEYQKGTLINVITKGMKRWKIMASKTAVLVIFWTAGYLLTFGITYGYNAYFWDNGIVQNLSAAVFGYYLAGLWLITVILPASALSKSSAAVTLSAGLAFVISYLLGFIPELKAYMPTYLMSSNELLAGTLHREQCVAAMGITACLMAVNVVLSVVCFNKKEI